MTEKMKLALIAAGTVLAVVGLVSYCSPYQSCARAYVAAVSADNEAYEALEGDESPEAAGARAAMEGNGYPKDEDAAERTAKVFCAKATG